jgi:hypothetical protein
VRVSVDVCACACLCMFACETKWHSKKRTDAADVAGVAAEGGCGGKMRTSLCVMHDCMHERGALSAH